MITWIEFNTYNNILAWYVNISDSYLHSMHQKHREEAMQLAKDIICEKVEIIPLEGEYKNIFWYKRKI